MKSYSRLLVAAGLLGISMAAQAVDSATTTGSDARAVAESEAIASSQAEGRQGGTSTASAQAYAQAVAQAVAENGGNAQAVSAAYAEALAQSKSTGSGKANAEASARAISEAVARSGGNARAVSAAYARAIALANAQANPGSPPAEKPGHTRPDKQATLVFRGTVTYVPLSGGFYGIVARDGRKFDPVNLPENYKRDGLQVRVRARPIDRFTTRMWGQTIEIISIRRVGR